MSKLPKINVFCLFYKKWLSGKRFQVSGVRRQSSDAIKLGGSEAGKRGSRFRGAVRLNPAPFTFTPLTFIL